MVLAPRPWRLSLPACAGRATGARKAVPREEHEVSRQTIARGRPGCLAGTCQTRVRSFYPIAHGACGCRRHPAFPAPSFRRGSKRDAKLRRFRAVRTRAHVSTNRFGRVGKAQACPPSRARKQRWARRKGAFDHPAQLRGENECACAAASSAVVPDKRAIASADPGPITTGSSFAKAGATARFNNSTLWL